MRFGTWARRLMLAVGAVALLVVGGVAFGPLASFAQNTPTATEASPSTETSPSTTGISIDEAVQIASKAYPESNVVEVERDRERGKRIYEIEFADDTEVDVDATTGEVLKVDLDDRDDWDDWDDHDDDRRSDRDDYFDDDYDD